MTSSSKRRERDDRDRPIIGPRVGEIIQILCLLFLIPFLIISLGIIPDIPKVEGNVGSSLEYTVAVQDASPDEIHWYGWSRVWCSHKDVCKYMQSELEGKIPDDKYILWEKIDPIGDDDSKNLGQQRHWQYRRTLFDVGQGKWAIEDFRYIKDLSAFEELVEFDVSTTTTTPQGINSGGGPTRLGAFFERW
ncbi:hypothetical protein QBC37DRAFT_375139 [Rhypophila decipiens]|uniref:Uncharacterized protein n=1 Tax=Rhypophila decipiens TaxID=261697 RepID=A0AAN6Y4G4_9PEZI|nr:hypothetical protein QBC37DRAFT_375139 [Rhypophila decipiens]